MASTSNQIGSSFNPRWDVFLSFRGEDTRRNFTGHLYKALDREGIQTFMDDPELPRGEEISPALLEAIQESKISIVVISKNYAFSRWCLNELVNILECKKTMGQLVLPVFYKVTPSDMRYQYGSFAEAFEKHKIRHVGNKVEKWRTTLTQVANLSGYHLDENGNEPDLIDQIVDRVWDVVKPRNLDVAKKPVGIASHIKNIAPLLSIGTDGVRKIGIYGMGGVGKTTAAKAVYNENFHSFQGSCFLANVREVSGQLNGIVRLQEQLVSDVLKANKSTITNEDNGISLIRDTIRSKRVLIVLDDLDHLKQLHYLAGQWNLFASGSIIMITTRSARLLDQIQVDKRYMVEELNHNDSLKLLSLHAFGKTKPLDDFMELSQKIIGYAGGLPLAIEVFGSYLFNQDKSAWKCFIKKLQENPNPEIEEKLKISFDALEDSDLKDIFLDIACFFIGKKKDEAITILSACYSCAENDIGILIKGCLLKFNKKNELRMHDLLQDLGRKIARNKFPREPQKHSRLWRCRDIRNVLEKDKGTESIEGIVSYDGGYFLKKTLNTKTFERMHRLRLIDISGVHLEGSFAHIFEELRWLRWSYCSLQCLPSDFHPKKLVILDLDSSEINTLWHGNLYLEHLTILDLRRCRFLKTTIDFADSPSLKKLVLSYCSSLDEIHPSIGLLGKLVYLDLMHCTKLGILPSSICNLTALESLNIGYCKKLKELPEEFGNIRNLMKLLASGSGIRKLPDSIGRLTSLVHLNFESCKDLEILTSEVCNLRALEDLNVKYCSNLEGLPDELGNIESIRVLRACYGPIKKLPDSIGLLRNLLELDLDGCSNLIELPSSTGRLRGLDRLSLNGCSNLESLPEELGMMESLMTLLAEGTPIKNLPDSIGQLSKLVELDLLCCKGLRFLPDSICNLRALKHLNLNGCSNLERLPQELGSIESLESLSASRTLIIELPDSIGRLSKLLELNLCYCEGLRFLPDNICNLRALKRLNLNGCSNLERLPQELGSIESFESLSASRTLIIELPDSIGRLTKLLELNLCYCEGLRFLPDNICSLRALKRLDLEDCSNLERLPQELGSIESLETLSASRTLIIELPDSIRRLTKLLELNLSYCKNLRNIPSSICNTRALEKLRASGCTSLERLPNLSNLEKLTELDLGNCSRLVEIQGLENLKSLRQVQVEGCSRLVEHFRLQMVENGFKEVCFEYILEVGGRSWWAHDVSSDYCPQFYWWR